MELLTNQAFEDATPRVVLAKLHAIRKEGNRAAHGENVDVPTSLWLLKEAFDLACWLHLTHGGGPRTDFPAYTPPPEIEGSAVPPSCSARRRQSWNAWRPRKRSMQQFLTDLGAARAAAQAAEADAAQVRATQSRPWLRDARPLTPCSSMRKQHAGNSSTSCWPRPAGTLVGPAPAPTRLVRSGSRPGTNRAPVQGGPITSSTTTMALPSESSRRRKRRSTPRMAEPRRRCYADSLQRQHGVRPFIFCTNGYDMWFWNDAETSRRAGRMAFPRKDSLQYRRFQRSEQAASSTMAPSDGDHRPHLPVSKPSSASSRGSPKRNARPWSSWLQAPARPAWPWPCATP